jgi:phage-related baseplate assembly protein
MSLTTIDLSQLPAPDAVESLDVELIYAETLADFRARYPAFTAVLESDMVLKLIQAVDWREYIMRQRVNDAVRAVLSPFAKGADLDNVAARQGVARLILVPATDVVPAVMESDANLLRRYLLSFDRPSAGSASRYLYEVFTVFPEAGDASVVGRAVHGRRGDTDIVISGPAGRNPTAEELAAVHAAVLAPGVQPEAVRVTVLAATRREYTASLVIEVPKGPDAALVRLECGARVRAAANARTIIGGEVPEDLLSGAAYGPNIIKVRDLAPVTIVADPYVVPVCTAISVAVEVRP